MADLDIALLPFLGVRTGLVIHCEFLIPRPRIDFERHGLVYLLKDMCSLYPDIKDTYNIFKYFTDALTRVFYANDNCLVNVAASKAYPGDNQYGTTGWAQVRVSSIH
jgi:Holliday junction resolvase RusA-like endonuclease